MIRNKKPSIQNRILRWGCLVPAVVLLGGLGSHPAVASVVGPSDDLGNPSADEAVENTSATEEQEGIAQSTNAVPPLRLNPPGDLDGSGMVDQGDLDLVLANWGRELSMIPTRWVYDRPDDLVAQATLDMVLVNWGKTGTSGSPVAVMPEAGTGTVALLLLGSVLFGRVAYRAAFKGIERRRAPAA